MRLLTSWVCIVLLWLGLFGCTTSDPDTSPEVAVAPTQTEERFVVATFTPVLPTATPTITPTPSLTPVPPTATATVTPSPTVSPTPMPRLTVREPDLHELQTYLARVPVRFFSKIESTTEYFEGYFDQFPLTESVQIMYEDVNGSGELDLIVADLQPYIWGRGMLVVLLWENGYGEPLLLTGSAKYSPKHRVLLEDWLGDGKPEIIYDFQSDTGGTGYSGTTRTRYVIQCHEQCDVIWWHVTGRHESYYTVGWTHTEVEQTVIAGNPTLLVSSESFYSPGLEHVFFENVFSRVYSRGYWVLTSTEKVFTWNGTIFELNDERVVSSPYYVESDSILTATHSSGAQAVVLTEFRDDEVWNPIYNCTLSVNGLPFHEPFYCNPAFTTVAWRDIIGDGREEIVVTALAFAKQRLLAFRWNGTEARLIADVSGDVIRSDLFGVALDDLDGDGQLVIRAGLFDRSSLSFCAMYPAIFSPDREEEEVCWDEWHFTEVVYKWDGFQYVRQDE
jgi:hypothetical protein